MQILIAASLVQLQPPAFAAKEVLMTPLRCEIRDVSRLTIVSVLCLGKEYQIQISLGKKGSRDC